MRRAVPRALAAGALVVAVAVALLVLTDSGPSYRVQAQFADAGQLVRGDLVEVGGRTVGKVTAIRLTGNGLADVELTLHGGEVSPLHQGTIAAIRTVGLSAVANRFVDLSPGPPNQPKIPSGGVLPTSQTRGVVDLDMLLDAANPTTRNHLRSIVRDAARAFRKPGAQQVNAALGYLNPALSRTAALGREVVLDQGALDHLVAAAGTASRAVAAREADLGDAIDGTADTLDQIAAQRSALTDVLDRAPAVARQTQGSLAQLDRTLPKVNPVLRGLRPSIAPLAKILRDTPGIAHNAEPAIVAIRALLPQAKAALAPIPRLDREASPALASTTSALRNVLPIVAGLRVYTPDLVGGFFNGFGGATAPYYDANGHYVRISLQGGGSSFPGLASVPPPPGQNGLRTGLTARCPGAAEEPAPDRTNPWVPPDTPGICDPKDDHQG